MKTDIVPGHASVSDLWYWIEERTLIWHRRMQGLPKPWTQDEILREFKFTNAFRQLDRGTIVLNKMLEPHINYDIDDNPGLIVFNIMWYRLFNLDTHARELGWVRDYQEVEDYILDIAKRDQRIFTSAHMTTGVSGEPKYVTYLTACRDAWNRCDQIAKVCTEKQSMEQAFVELLESYMVGKFIAYEIVCDLRFTPLLGDAGDINSWANVGPGAARGLKRLGMPETLASMMELYHRYMEDHQDGGAKDLVYYPFELREIEHSLCEFDKYQRVKTGAGRPRQKYDGG